MTMPKLTVFFGDVDEALARHACQHDAEAFLVDYSNYKQFVVGQLDHDTTVYTSLGDLPKDLEVVYNILMTADQIVYCPPDVWSDHVKMDVVDPGKCIQGLSEQLIIIVSDHVPVKNLELAVATQTAIPLVDTRRTSEPQLWAVGCSVTSGVGVELHQRYGQLLADELEIECSFLASPGTSLAWAADQIIRSDIRKNDIVVWGITNSERVTFVHENGVVQHINVNSYQQNKHLETIVPISTLSTKNTFYHNINSVDQVINYCEKSQATLVMVDLLPCPNQLRFLKSKNHFWHYPYRYTFTDNKIINNFKDLGTDNSHPGAKQHQEYKNFILEKLQKIIHRQPYANYMSNDMDIPSSTN